MEAFYEGVKFQSQRVKKGKKKKKKITPSQNLPQESPMLELTYNLSEKTNTAGNDHYS